MSEITKHAKKRLKERNGITKKSCGRIADRVLERGITHAELNGSLRRWADKLYLSYRVANNMRFYGDKAYLFRGDRLITVIQIPIKYMELVNKLQKEKKDTDI